MNLTPLLKKVKTKTLLIIIVLSTICAIASISVIILLLINFAGKTTTTPCLNITQNNAAFKDGLVLYFPFNKNTSYGENATLACDFSMHSNNGIIHGAKWTKNGGVNNSGGLVFDGLSDYITVKDDVTLSPKNGQLTVSFYVKFASTTFSPSSSNYINYLGKGSPRYGYEWIFRLYNQSNSENRSDRLSFYVFNSTGGLGAGSYVQEKIRTNEWIHITGTLNGTHVKIYKNGKLKNVNPIDEYGIILKRGTSDLHIGSIDGKNYLNGSIDELKIYQKTLNDDEVMQLYLLNLPLK